MRNGNRFILMEALASVTFLAGKESTVRASALLNKYLDSKWVIVQQAGYFYQRPYLLQQLHSKHNLELAELILCQHFNLV